MKTESPILHGGGLDQAIAEFGGRREDWLDLSTGINPESWPLPAISGEAWTRLPDRSAQAALTERARNFWNIPDGRVVVAAPGTSSLIALLPRLLPGQTVAIPDLTYGEFLRSFSMSGWRVVGPGQAADVAVLVHPNNPDGKPATDDGMGKLTLVDESFADCGTYPSYVARAGSIVLKGFGKFWGLAGLRLGFVVADPPIAARIEDALGPWPVSGPALAVGAAALADVAWAEAARQRLKRQLGELDEVLMRAGLTLCGGTPLFRLVETDGAGRLWRDLASRRILTRKFDNAPRLLRLGLPGSGASLRRLDQALREAI